MNYSTKNEQYWSFWCHWWSNHRDQEVFWENKAVDAVEANEVTEAAKVNEVTVVSKAWKITIEDFRVVLVLEFNILRNIVWCFEKKNFWQNHENSRWIFCWRLLRPAYVIFLKTGGWNSNAITSGIHRYLQTKSNLHISMCQSQFKRNISKWDTL
jgi:hypothetical protein